VPGTEAPSRASLHASERGRLLDRALMTAFFNNIPDYVYFKDLKSRYIQLSISCCRRFGKELPIDIIGRTDFDFYDRQHAQETYDDEQRIIASGKSLFKKLEKEIWPEGRVTWVITNKLPLHDEHGDIIGTLGFSKEVTKEKELEASIDRANQELLDASREAGKAEVAISVLHNVGNALNSVNVSASLIAGRLRQSKTASLTKVVDLLAEHQTDLGKFIDEDLRGKKVPELIGTLGKYFLDEREQLLVELQSLQKNVAHIKQVVAEQQAYAAGTRDAT
jgi:PAS domain S-box-containing protein